MATIYVDLEEQYAIPAGSLDNFLVDLTIGNGQIGGYMIFMDQQLIASNKQANLGPAQLLVNKRCLLVATIQDTLTETNWTSVVIQTQCGPVTKNFGPYSKQVPAHLDTIVYTITIAFQNT